MKVYIKYTAVLLALVVLALSLTMNVTAAPASYSTTKNAGLRGEVCTTLDGTSTQSYYTGNYTYGALSVLSANDLLTSLRALMTSTHTRQTSYSDCRDMSVNTDCQNGDGSIVLLYTSAVVTRNDFIGSGSIGWNREHVWPKSLGGFGNEGVGADLHHVRPDDVTTNAVRGNLKYGNVNGGSDVKGSTLVGGAVGGQSGGGYFEPLDNVKGDVARICLYVYVRYGGELSNCNNITNVFQSINILLEWCESDPVDTWEMGRNEVIASIQGNRNVFIDYPEYAWLLFDREIPTDMTTPSGMAKGGSPDRPDASCHHLETELRGVVAATCTTEGYTGDTYCKTCGEKLSDGDIISTDEGHAYSEWVDAGAGEYHRICTMCAHLDIKKETASPDLTPNAPTDETSSGCSSVYGVSVFPLMLFAAWAMTKKTKKSN